jgi:hypothetical protein
MLPPRKDDITRPTHWLYGERLGRRQKILMGSAENVPATT